MLRIVIDTSSLVSYVLTQGELMRRVVAHWRAGTFMLLSSPATRAELADVLARPSIRQLATAPLDKLVQGDELIRLRVESDRFTLCKAHAAALLRWRGHQVPPAEALRDAA